MKHVLISLDEEYVAKLKRLAKDGKGMKKGAISATVKEGIDLVEKEQRRKLAWKRLWVLMNEDVKWGIGKFKREDAYDDPRFG